MVEPVSSRDEIAVYLSQTQRSKHSGGRLVHPGSSAGVSIVPNVVEDHAERVLGTLKTLEEAIDQVRRDVCVPHVARVRLSKITSPTSGCASRRLTRSHARRRLMARRHQLFRAGLPC